MKVSLILNTYNEGPDVRWTFESLAAAAGDVEIERIVLADGTTDGSCDNLDDSILVLKPDTKVGIGKAKDIATQHATGDVLFYNDAHNRLQAGTLEDIARYCLDHEPCIVTPTVAPLRCKHGGWADKGKTKARCERWGSKDCQNTCDKYADAAGLDNCHYGGKIELDWGREEEMRVQPARHRPDQPESETGAVNFSTFAMSRKTLEAIGGWNRYPGWWGSQELGVALRAQFARVPIILLRDVVILHRYRSWRRRDGSAIADYQTPEGHRTANQMYALRVVLDDLTWQETWLPWFERKGDAPAMKLFAESEAEAQHAAFCGLSERSRCRAKTRKGGRCKAKVTEAGSVNQFCRQHRARIHVDFVGPLKKIGDEVFYNSVLNRPYPPTWHLAEGANRAVYFLRGALGDIVMSIPAQKALAELAGEPIDIYDGGFHQPDMAALLERQPWVRKITKDRPDLTYYKYAASMYWCKGPGFAPTESRVGVPNRHWRRYHEVESNMQAVRQCGYEGPAPAMTLGSWEEPENLLPPEPVVIGVGGRSHDRKKYPHWQQTCEQLKAAGVPLVFVGVKDTDEPWMDTCGLNLCGPADLLTLAGVLHMARLYVGIDNGPSHLAAAMGTPQIVLYGPTQERKNVPWAANVKVLRADEYGCCCYEHPRRNACSISDGTGKAFDVGPCMRALRPEYVAKEVLASLDTPGWTRDLVRARFYSAKQRVENAGLKFFQHAGEMAGVLELLCRAQVTRIIEIGVCEGGWSYCTAETLGGPMEILNIDPTPWGGYERMQAMIRGAGHRLQFIHMTSDDARTEAGIWAEGHDLADVLHIDGCHEMPQVLRDWQNYSPLVRPGGYVIFHDISPHRDKAGPYHVFDHVSQTHQSWTFSSSKVDRGTGVIRLAGSDGAKRSS